MLNLKPMLREMLNSARAAPGTTQRRSLDAVAVAEVTQSRNGDVILVLSRPQRACSITEWRNVLYAWPESIPVEGPVYATRKEGRLYRSVLRWPRPTVIVETA